MVFTIITIVISLGVAIVEQGYLQRGSVKQSDYCYRIATEWFKTYAVFGAMECIDLVFFERILIVKLCSEHVNNLQMNRHGCSKFTARCSLRPWSTSDVSAGAPLFLRLPRFGMVATAE
jgi:hypothetical protein